MARIVGPVHRCRRDDGTTVPLYALAFDKGGVCTSPRSREVLYEDLRGGATTDVILASHGWNTTPKGAIATYTRWMAGYAASTQAAATLRPPRRLVVVGVIWPSTWMVPLWERGPQIAGDSGDSGDADGALAALVSALAEGLPDQDRARVHELADAEDLGEADARELAELLVAARAPGDADGELDAGAPDVDVLLAGWRSLGRSDAPVIADDPDAPLRPLHRPASSGQPSEADEPQVAGRVGRAPADLLRLLSVWQMKDRAAVVGARGVADTLRGILAAGGDTMRVHAVGHSFGCKVLLSAIASPMWAPLPADRLDSLLLIQPAINGYAFADAIPQAGGRPGGYRDVRGKVRQSILTTFSSHDLPLRQAFHLALRRADDLTEAQIAADEPPSEFAALGGYGPRGVSSADVIDMPAAGEPYPPSDVDVLGLRAHQQIDGHGDHDNPATHWALRSLIAGRG